MAQPSTCSRLIYLAWSCLAISVLTACGADQLPAPAISEKSSNEAQSGGHGREVSAALNGEWRLIAIDRTTLSQGGAPTLTFGASGHCWGNTGVNEFRTDFKLTAPGHGQLELGNAAVTRKMGPPEAMAVEKLFLTRLQSAESYEIRGDRLYIHSGENQDLTFERAYP